MDNLGMRGVVIIMFVRCMAAWLYWWHCACMCVCVCMRVCARMRECLCLWDARLGL